MLQMQERAAQDSSEQVSHLMGLREGWRRKLPEDVTLHSSPGGEQSNPVHLFPLLRVNERSRC